jgi:hypothetical protein
MDVSLARTVENLFDLLPRIRAERHAYFYDKEIRKQHENHWEGSIEPHLATLTWIQEQPGDVEHIIAARDNIVRDQGSDDILVPTIAKLQARLERSKEDRAQTAKPTGDEGRLTDVQPRLEELSKTIGTRILELWNLLTFQANIVDRMNLEVFDPPAKGTEELKSLKLLDASPQLDKEASEALRKLLGSLDNDLSALVSRYLL